MLGNRSKKKMLVSLEDDGSRLLEKKEEIESHVVNFYKKLFSTEHSEPIDYELEMGASCLECYAWIVYSTYQPL